MRLLVWGAGAIGGTVGAYLARAGHDVTWVDRVAEHVAAIDAGGLSITGPVDEFTVRAPAFTPEEVTGEWDTVLLCTKAQHTEEASRMLEPHLSESGCVVSLQNGLNELVIGRVVGEERTLGAFINFGADYLEPGVIHYGGRGAVVVGELGGAQSERLQRIHRALLDFDDRAVATDNIWGYLWGKLAVGAMLFATALTDASIADALASERHRSLFLELPREVLRVADARGVRAEGFNGFDPPAFSSGADPAAAERSLEEMVAFNRRSAKTHSGVWRDLAVRKRRTEVDHQLAPIVTLAAEAGLNAPLVAGIVEHIHQIEEGTSEQGWHHLDALVELVEA